MFDIDNLDTFIGSGPRKQQGEEKGPLHDAPAREKPAAPAAAPPREAWPVSPDEEQRSPAPEPARTPAAAADAAPKSREERLRDFYAGRQQQQQQQPQQPQQPQQQQLQQQPQQQHQQQLQQQQRDGTTAVQSREPDAETAAEALKMKKHGNDQYQAGDYEAAVELYSTAIKLAPSSVLHANRAAAYMALGWWDQALRDTKKAVNKDPSNTKALERHGKVLLALDKLDDALRVSKDLETQLVQEEAARKGGVVKQPMGGTRRLRWLSQAARDPATLDECRAVLAEFGTKQELMSPLGTRLRRRLSKALVERADAIENQRKIRPALARNRRTEEDGDEIQEITPYAEEALRVTAELLEDDPDNAEVRYWRGRALVRLGRHADAEVQLKRGLKGEPENEQMRELVETISSLEEIKIKGNEFYKDGRLGEAIQCYTMGIESDPTCMDTRTVATLYYNRSAAHRKKGEFHKALEDANTCLALHPKWTKALYRRGILLLECGRSVEALTELKVVQRADPTFDDDLDDWLRRAHHWMAKPLGGTNYYEFMRLPMDSSKDEIKKQYRRLCLTWHPDKNGDTEEGRQRFEDLQKAYKFLMDDEQRDKYDFGIWKDRPVRHHVKVRHKVKDTYDDTEAQEEDPKKPHGWGDKHLEEDEKVESIYWGEQGVPAWLKEKRRENNRKRYGWDA